MAASRSLFADAEGEGQLFRPKKLADSEMDITPMIDCVFQLLIFFMVASNMTGGRTLDLPVARYGVGVETNRTTVITLQAGEGPGDRPQIVLDGARQGDLEAVRRLVNERKAQGVSQVVIKAERRVAHRFVQDVARAVMETEGVEFFIGVQDK
ncbi:MAG: ExbD/TolR family protein [Planctomycetaceae bacterium]